LISDSFSRPSFADDVPRWSCVISLILMIHLALVEIQPG
jgi:hypothetical protein